MCRIVCALRVTIERDSNDLPGVRFRFLTTDGVIWSDAPPHEVRVNMEARTWSASYDDGQRPTKDMPFGMPEGAYDRKTFDHVVLVYDPADDTDRLRLNEVMSVYTALLAYRMNHLVDFGRPVTSPG